MQKIVDNEKKRVYNELRNQGTEQKRKTQKFSRLKRRKEK